MGKKRKAHIYIPSVEGQLGYPSDLIERAVNERGLRRTPLARRTALARTGPLKRTDSLAVNRSSGRARPVSPASHVQRRKVALSSGCVVCGADSYEATIDPAHLCSRAQGGCDAALCVVPMCRQHHMLLDTGQLDVLRHLVPTYAEEVQHALGHYNGNLIGLLHRLTGERYVPAREAA